MLIVLGMGLELLGTVSLSLRSIPAKAESCSERAQRPWLGFDQEESAVSSHSFPREEQ